MTMSEGDLAVAQMKFVRRDVIEQQPPPAALRGVIGWIHENLLSSAFNIVLTILIGLLASTVNV